MVKCIHVSAGDSRQLLDCGEFWMFEFTRGCRNEFVLHINLLNAGRADQCGQVINLLEVIKLIQHSNHPVESSLNATIRDEAHNIPSTGYNLVFSV